MLGSDLEEGRDVVAPLEGVRAPVPEPTPGKRVVRPDLLRAWVHIPFDGREQVLGVGVPLLVEQVDGAVVSITCPPKRTTTRSVISATAPRSWVMNTTPAEVSAARSLMRSKICAWIVTSSAVVGSSAIRTCGRHASAMAIMTRWHMPPDSWWG